ncbi:unnamed protein product [Clonostachys byssicola]|uniref:Uncharacterized protein n=1 Tax=Clonostachys byssicola TaxID=160290 RepID=A0A9N9XX60_9HYPO|nr:unnamed protein product [Clonostachys byssicola]
MAKQNLIPTVLLLSCALLGGYGAMYTSFREGFFDALRECVYPSATKPSQCKLHVPHASQMPKFTGVPFIDENFALLVEFFQQGLPRMNPGGVESFEDIVATLCWTSQYGAIWTMISLEGLRKGNQGTAVAYTGLWGMMFQALTVTIFSPIYYISQLYLSPAQTTQTYAAVDIEDLEALPRTIALTYLLPTLGLILPLFGLISPKAAYYAISVWQLFPLLKSAVHPFMRSRKILKEGEKNIVVDQRGDSYKRALNRVYRFAFLLAASTYFLHFSSVLLKSQSSLSATLKGFFIPGSLSHPPTFALFNPPVSASASQDIVITFLKWDLYCAGAALLIWSSTHASRVLGGSEMPKTIAKSLPLMALGGPVATAVALLRQRDMKLLATPIATSSGKKNK